MHVRKLSRIPQAEFVPWTAAHFQNQEARDRFLLLVAETLQANNVEAEPMEDTMRGAMVRWRPGNFLCLHDVVHAHGGRIESPRP